MNDIVVQTALVDGLACLTSFLQRTASLDDESSAVRDMHLLRLSNFEAEILGRGVVDSLVNFYNSRRNPVLDESIRRDARTETAVVAIPSASR